MEIGSFRLVKEVLTKNLILLGFMTYELLNVVDLVPVFIFDTFMQIIIYLLVHKYLKHLYFIAAIKRVEALRSVFLFRMPIIFEFHLKSDAAEELVKDFGFDVLFSLLLHSDLISTLSLRHYEWKPLDK